MGDFRHAVRSLRRQPAFTAIAVTTFALGIGINTAIFSTVHTVILRPFPQIPNADQVAWLFEYAGKVDDERDAVELANLADWQRQSRSFDAIAGMMFARFTMTGAGAPERVHGFQVTAAFFDVMGIRAQRGRVFGADEDRPGQPPVVVLTDAFWRRRLGADPQVVGKSLVFEGLSFTVIGVLPPGFYFPRDRSEYGPQFYVPLAARPEDWADRVHPAAAVVASLRRGVTTEQANAELMVIAERLEKQYPETNRGIRVHAIPIQKLFTARAGTPFFALFLAGGFVLLIACANVASLLLARGTARERELAVRQALGASRARLVRHLLVESLLVATLGAVVGVALAHVSLAVLVSNLPDAITFEIPRFRDLTIEGWALAFALTIAVASGLGAGILPALRLSRTRFHQALQSGAPGVARGGRRLHGAFVVAQVALCVVLLGGTATLGRSFRAAVRLPMGTDTHGVLTLALPLAGEGPADWLRATNQLLGRVTALPGVEHVAGAWGRPIANDRAPAPKFTVEGRPPPPAEEVPWASCNGVTPGFFSTHRIPLLRGRAFSSVDGEKGPYVVAVSDAIARRFFPGQDPIGQRLRFEDRTWAIVGVVGDVFGRRKLSGTQSVGELYVPLAQMPPPYLYLSIRGQTTAEAARATIRAVDPRQVIEQADTMQALVERMWAPERLLIGLGLGFAGLALLLAWTGMYGLVAYSVSQRTREIGIRMAIGGSSGAIVGLLAQQTLRYVAAGGVMGAGLALLLVRGLHAVFALPAVGIALPLLAGMGVLALAALLAALIPASRATKVDPVVVLRAE